MQEFDDRHKGGLLISDDRNTVVLSAGAAQSIAVPNRASIVLFSADADFWADYDSTAIVPSVSITNGTSPELNPTLRRLNNVSNISLISTSAAKIQISFYQ